MLFSEYYGEYYACVSEILSEAVEGTLTMERVSEIASKQGFGESVLTIPANLKNGNWPLITPDCRTRIRHIPYHPVTLLEKRWLKACSVKREVWKMNSNSSFFISCWFLGHKDTKKSGKCRHFPDKFSLNP